MHRNAIPTSAASATCETLETRRLMANHVWTGAVSGDWNDAANWEKGVVPDLDEPLMSVRHWSGPHAPTLNGDLKLHDLSVKVNLPALKVNGTVSLSGILWTWTPVALPASGSFTLIENDGTDPVQGSFYNAPEGSILWTGYTAGKPYWITYQGGDGNDVVVTRIPSALKQSTLTVTPSKLGVMEGESVSYRVRAHGLLAGQATPRGQIALRNGDGDFMAVRRLDANGEANFTATPGSSWFFEYYGDPAQGFNRVQTQLPILRLAAGQTHVELRSVPSPAAGKLILTARVIRGGRDGEPFTGTITFRYEGHLKHPDQVLATVAVGADGYASAVIDIGNLPPSSMENGYSFFADYNGDARHQASTSYQHDYVPEPHVGGAGGGRYVDLNSDGKLDVIFRNHAGAVIVLLLNENGIPLGDGYVLPEPEEGWSLKETADLNADGNAELIFQHQSTGKAMAWILTPDGGVRFAPVANPNASAWRVEGADDFNDDGKSDLIWRNERTGQVAVWLMRGTTAHGCRMIPAAPKDLDWGIGEIGDFNGDGNADLLWRHNKTGQNYVWFLDGTKLTGGRSLDRMAADGWDVAGVFDLDGDDNEDIVFRNAATGERLVWFMENGAVREAEEWTGVFA